MSAFQRLVAISNKIWHLGRCWQTGIITSLKRTWLKRDHTTCQAESRYRCWEMDPTFARLPTDACVYIQHTHSLDLRFLEDGEFVANGLLGFIKRLVHEVLEPHERADLTLQVLHRALQTCQAADRNSRTNTTIRQVRHCVWLIVFRGYQMNMCMFAHQYMYLMGYRKLHESQSRYLYKLSQSTAHFTRMHAHVHVARIVCLCYTCLLTLDDMTNFTSLTPVTWETRSVFTTESRRTTTSRAISDVTSGM